MESESESLKICRLRSPGFLFYNQSLPPSAVLHIGVLGDICSEKDTMTFLDKTLFDYRILLSFENLIKKYVALAIYTRAYQQSMLFYEKNHW